MDRVGADFKRVVGQIGSTLSANAVPVVVPVLKDQEFTELADLLTRQVSVSTDQYALRSWTDQEASFLEPQRQKLIEALAEIDDEILEDWLAGRESGVDKLYSVLRTATLEGTVVPVLAGSAFKNKGMEMLLDAIVNYLPSPQDRQVYSSDGQVIECDPNGPALGLVFKVVETPHGSQAFLRIYRGRIATGTTLVNVGQGQGVRVGRLAVVLAAGTKDVPQAQAGDIVALLGAKDMSTGHTLAVPDDLVQLEVINVSKPVLAWRLTPKTSSDTQKLSSGLAHLVREDPSLVLDTDPQTGEVVLWGMGELHLEVAVERLRREYSANVQVGLPLVAYQEQLSKSIENVDVVLSKQTGGKGQYARVVINLTPRQDEQVHFQDKTKGGVIPHEFVIALEKGILDGLGEGPSGYPVVGLSITLVDGETHPVDSSAQAFSRVGQMAIRQALAQAGTDILEPVMHLDIAVPEDGVGGVVSDIARRNGRVEKIDPQPEQVNVSATAPLSRLSGYATALRSLTAGRGQASMTLRGYEKVVA